MESEGDHAKEELWREKEKKGRLCAICKEREGCDRLLEEGGATMARWKMWCHLRMHRNKGTLLRKKCYGGGVEQRV